MASVGSLTDGNHPRSSDITMRDTKGRFLNRCTHRDIRPLIKQIQVVDNMDLEDEV